MEITIQVPTYDPEKGFQFHWENGFEIKTQVSEGQILISANKEGLISFANHLLNLAQDGMSAGSHIHLDEYNSLEEGSVELVIEKI
ncbi:MAG TPA: hypothetical protein VI233_05350 [Puia sp.]